MSSIATGVPQRIIIHTSENIWHAQNRTTFLDASDEYRKMPKNSSKNALQISSPCLSSLYATKATTSLMILSMIDYLFIMRNKGFSICHDSFRTWSLWSLMMMVDSLILRRCRDYNCYPSFRILWIHKEKSSGLFLCYSQLFSSTFPLVDWITWPPKIQFKWKTNYLKL